MSKVAQTQFGTGRVVEESRDRMGKMSYKVQGDGWETWVEAASILPDMDPRPTTVDYENSTTLPYNPRPQHPSNIYVNPLGDMSIDADERLHPADSVTWEERPYNEAPGPAPHLFAQGSRRTADYDHLDPNSFSTNDGPQRTRDLNLPAMPDWEEEERSWANDPVREYSRHASDGFVPDGVEPEDIGWPSETHPSGPKQWEDEPYGADPRFAAVPEEFDKDSLLAQLRHDPQRLAQDLQQAHHAGSAPIEPRVAAYYEASINDKGLRTAAWKDVRAKALRLRRDSQVEPIGVTPESIYAYVQGDTDIYETIVVRGAAFTGSNSITEWDCTCEWGRWAFKRQYTYVGRLCSHAYAAYLEMQSQHQRKDKGNAWYASRDVTARASDELEQAAQSAGWEIDQSTDWAGMVTGSTFRKDGLIIGIQYGGVLDGGIKLATICEQDPLGWAGTAIAPETTDISTVMGWLGGRTASRQVRAEDGTGNTDGGAVPSDQGDGGEAGAPLGYQYDPNQMLNENSTMMAGRAGHGAPEGYLTNERGSLDFDVHHINDKPDVTFRHDLEDNRGLIGASIGLEAAIIDIERVSDPEDQALLDRLRNLSDEGNRPQKNDVRNRELRRLVQLLHDRGYNAENLTAALEVRESTVEKAARGELYEPAHHEPFNGSGRAEPIEYSTSETYVNEHERDHHELLVAKTAPISNEEYRRNRLGKAPQAAEGGSDGDHGFREASLSDIQSFGSADPLAGSGGESGGGIRTAGSGGGLDENDPALAMFTTVEMSERTAAAPGSSNEDPLAYLLPGGGGSSHVASSDDGDDLSHLMEGMPRTAGRAYSFKEQEDLINEASVDGAPFDQSGLDLSGTHYVS